MYMQQWPQDYICGAGQDGFTNYSKRMAQNPRSSWLERVSHVTAITTSEFGMRQHPVIGRWLMHAGKDLAAPEGTPVIAALSGTVMSSGLAGGYGIAVEVEHKLPRRRTLYGHLSEIYVKSGQKVQQGEVIGRVGSTGLSTGPHLHFELRMKQGNGWVAKNPGEFDLNPITASGSDAVSMLVGQLMNSLERDKV